MPHKEANQNYISISFAMPPALLKPSWLTDTEEIRIAAGGCRILGNQRTLTNFPFHNLCWDLLFDTSGYEAKKQPGDDATCKSDSKTNSNDLLQFPKKVVVENYYAPSTRQVHRIMFYPSSSRSLHKQHFKWDKYVEKIKHFIRITTIIWRVLERTKNATLAMSLEYTRRYKLV